MRNYVGTGTYIVGLVAALCAVALLNGALSRVSAQPTVGYRVVQGVTGGGPSTQIRTHVVNCPAGTHVLGGGGSVVVAARRSGPATGPDVGKPDLVPDPNGVLVASKPTGGNNGWQASGIDRTPGHSWSVSAYAVCAKI